MRRKCSVFVRSVDGMEGIGGAKHNVRELLSLHCSHRSVTETCSVKVELQSACSMCGSCWFVCGLNLNAVFWDMVRNFVAEL